MLWNLYIAELLSSAEAPAGYPSKYSNQIAIHRAPRAFFFFLPASLRQKEVLAEEKEVYISCRATYPQYTFENQLSWTR